MMAESRESAQKLLRESLRVEYFCREDAEAAAARLRGEGSPFHYCACTVAEKIIYARGRPPRSGERRIGRVR